MNLRKCFLAVLLVLSGWAGTASAVPITAADQVVVNGTTWAQADLFSGLSWNDINAACPAGSCYNGFTLNNYDMTGWTWASAVEISSLYQAYGAPYVPPTGGDLNQFQTAWAPAFFADGWRKYVYSDPYFDGVHDVYAWTSTTYTPGNGAYSFIRWGTGGSNGCGICSDIIQMNANVNATNAIGGGWFYYDGHSLEAPSAAPAPGVISLITLGLAALGITRRKRAIDF